MDLTITLLKQLGNSLSTTELLFVVAIILASTIWGVKFFVKNRDALAGFLNKDSGANKSLDKVYARLDTLATKNDLDKLILQIDTTVKERTDQLDTDFSIIREKLESIAIMRRDVEELKTRVVDDITEIRQLQESNSKIISGRFDEVLANIYRNHDTYTKLIRELEQIDEFMKQSVPEFRDYHHELTRTLAQLNKDLALVTAISQMQINNNNAVKLR